MQKKERTYWVWAAAILALLVLVLLPDLPWAAALDTSISAATANAQDTATTESATAAFDGQQARNDLEVWT